MAGWHNQTCGTADELATWMDENGIVISKIGAIIQDVMGRWHLFYKD